MASVEGCFREWADRTAADGAALTVRVRVAETGHVLDAEVSAVRLLDPAAVAPGPADLLVLRTCAEAAARRIALPAVAAVTRFDLRLDYNPDGLTVDALDIVSQPPPQRIDGAGP